jgi:hypothetical protein
MEVLLCDLTFRKFYLNVTIIIIIIIIIIITLFIIQSINNQEISQQNII